MGLLIRGGRVVDPVQGLDGRADILVEDGLIRQIQPELAVERGTVVVDAAGLVVVPGLVDMHTHLREPGQEAKETVATATRAAAKGGYTAVVGMPNTVPVVDTPGQVELVRARAAREGVVRVYQVGAITKGSRGEELAEMADLAAAGVVAFSDDGRPVPSAAVMRRAMEYALMFDMPIISHCEEPSLAEGGVMHEGFYSLKLGLKGIPALAEDLMVHREILLAENTGCRVHIAHLSTKGAVELVRQAKARGVPVTAEATPHHFTLTDAALEGYDTNFKVNPPLRTGEDVAAVIRGLADGTIDAIATDHAPHTEAEKAMEFDYAPFGMVGLETALPLAITRLVNPGVISWTRLVELMAINPCRILGLPGGSLQVGQPADITLINPDLKRTVDRDRLASLGRNTPFHGWSLQGWAVATMVGGQFVYQEEGV